MSSQTASDGASSRSHPPFPWRTYGTYFWPFRHTLLLVTIAGVVQSFIYVPMAALLRKVFDFILPSRDNSQLLIVAAELVALQIGSLILAYWMRLASLRMNQDVLREMREQGLARLYDLPRDFYTNSDLERLHVSLVYESNWVESMNNGLTVTFLPSAIAALALFFIMLYLQPQFALIIVITAPALFVGNRLMEREAWFRRESLRQAFESFSRGMRFVISAIDLTRAHVAERFEIARQSGTINRMRKISLELSRFDSIQQLLQGAMLVTCTLAVLVAGGYAVARGTISSGEMMAFYVVAALFATQAKAMVGAIPEIRMGMRGFREIHAIITCPHREPYSGTRAIDSLREIRLDNVAFSYSPGRPVLRDVSLTISPGLRVALIGGNGSGKTSIVYLIMGFYRPSRGIVSAAGIAYDELSMKSLRGRMAIVPQNPILFSGTIRDNVAYGVPDASVDDLQQALDWAGASEFVRAMPSGIDSEIGDAGVRLSGGQRQRLVLARALLRRPDLLILDEPTNHLDEDAIEHLMQSLDRLPFRPALLFISHEMRVLRHVDVAWKLVEGRIQEVPAGIAVRE